MYSCFVFPTVHAPLSLSPSLPLSRSLSLSVCLSISCCTYVICVVSSNGPYAPKILGWRPRGSGAMAGCVIHDPDRFLSLLGADVLWVHRCVLAATIGMLSVVWYSLGGHVSEEEMEHEARLHQEAKAKRGRLFGLIKPKA